MSYIVKQDPPVNLWDAVMAKRTKLVRIIVLAGQTFRGVLHYEEMSYDCSPNLAAYAVASGVARYA